MKRGFQCSCLHLAKLGVLAAAILSTGSLAGEGINQAGVGPGGGVRYATDAYPGFDSESSIIKPEKKTLGFFSWFTGPKMDDAAAQMAWADELAAEGSTGRARRAYDALVRAWPSVPEAPVAQLKLAQLEEADGDAIAACEEYRYLMDFFSSKCDYDAIARKNYEMCEKMREDGKRIVFFRFANTVDVRRAYEALVLRCPGAEFAPQAMLTIGALRVDEEKYPEAVAVYENLRNLRPKATEARIALHREAQVRMLLVEEHSYNRDRIRDTIDFLRSAIRSDCTIEERNDYVKWLAEARARLDTATYLGNKFYDSRTRTRRSAINAYKLYLEEYPEGEHAEEARARLAELEEAEKKGVVNRALGIGNGEQGIGNGEQGIGNGEQGTENIEEAFEVAEDTPDWLNSYIEEREALEEQALQKVMEDAKPKWYKFWLSN